MKSILFKCWQATTMGTQHTVLLLIFIYAATASAATLSNYKGHQMLEINVPEPDPSITRYPHETACHYFYHIDYPNNKVAVEKCPSGQIFDYRSHRCATREEGARCWSHHFERKLDRIQHPHPHETKHFSCPVVWRKYPDLKDCERYFVCLPKKVMPKRCPPEFPRFDNIDRKCVTEKEAVCAGEQDIPEADFQCPPSWGHMKHSKDCSKFYECFSGQPNLLTCPRNNLYDEQLRECLPRENVTCGDRRNPYVETHSELQSDTAVEEKDEQTTVKDPSTRSSEKADITSTIHDVQTSTDASEASEVTETPSPANTEERATSESTVDASTKAVSSDKQSTDHISSTDFKPSDFSTVIPSNSP